jgi:hypothetical protein
MLFYCIGSKAFGIATLPGDLNWVSSYEGLIMTIGVPFFVATFIFMGQRIAEWSPNTGIGVTVLGVWVQPLLPLFLVFEL